MNIWLFLYSKQKKKYQGAVFKDESKKTNFWRSGFCFFSFSHHPQISIININAILLPMYFYYLTQKLHLFYQKIILNINQMTKYNYRYYYSVTVVRCAIIRKCETFTREVWESCEDHWRLSNMLNILIKYSTT